MRARVLGMALLLLTAAANVAHSQEAASSPENENYPRAAVAHRPTEMSLPAVPLVYHRQSTFAIPFAVNQNSATPTDIILYASSDLGATWDPYSRQPTTQKQFVFRAARDGEYWFTSQLVGSGLPSPNAFGLTPQLKIVVDTQPPRLTLEAKSEPNAMVHVAWEAHDESLVPESVSLQYQTNPGQTWKPLDTPKEAADGLRQTLRGETRFRPERAATLVAVRLEAKDAADNVAELTRRLFLPLNITSVFGPPPDPQPTTTVPADPFAQHGFAPADTTQPSELNLPPPPPSDQASQPAPSAPSSEQPSAVAWPSRETSGGSQQSPPLDYQSNARSAGHSVARSASTDPRDQDAAGEGVGDPTLDDPPSEYEPLTNPETSESSNGLPFGQRPRMTNSKRFNLDYSIDAVGPQGVEKVELWATRNGGQDWKLWAVDEDRTSPMLVEVQEEGIYGFRIVIVGKNGLTSQTPRPGDPADLWVGVDTTPPVAEITSATYGKAEWAGHLDIQWTASDSGFGARPITLLISESARGPWTTIASGLPNTGQYHWRVDSRVPDQFYLRMEVRDEAGNLAEVQLSEPIRSAGLTPRGRIRNIEAVPQ
jgi:hypothetical protein